MRMYIWVPVLAVGVLLTLVGNTASQPLGSAMPPLPVWYERCTTSENRAFRFEACFVVVRDDKATPEQVRVAYAWICYDLANMNEWAYAHQMCTKATELWPQPSTLVNLGIVEHKLKHYDQALDTLTRAIAADPKRVGAYISRSRVYLDLGKQVEADADLAKAKELDPTIR